MKKIALVCLIVLCASSVFAGGAYSRPAYVGTNSQMIAPPRVLNPKSITGYLSNTAYTVGTLVSVDSTRVYMCTTNGTSGTSVPTHGVGLADDNTTQWLKVPSGARNNLVIVNNSTADVTLTVSSPAVVNAGQVLKANGGAYNLINTAYQGPIYAIAGSDDLIVGVTEF